MGGGGIPYPCRRREQFENYTGARKRVARHPAMTHCHAIRSGSGRWKFTRRWWKWASLGPHDDLNETGAIDVKCRGFVFSRQEKCSSSFIGNLIEIFHSKRNFFSQNFQNTVPSNFFSPSSIEGDRSKLSRKARYSSSPSPVDRLKWLLDFSLSFFHFFFLSPHNDDDKRSSASYLREILDLSFRLLPPLISYSLARWERSILDAFARVRRGSQSETGSILISNLTAYAECWRIDAASEL